MEVSSVVDTVAEDAAGINNAKDHAHKDGNETAPATENGKDVSSAAPATDTCSTTESAAAANGCAVGSSVDGQASETKTTTTDHSKSEAPSSSPPQKSRTNVETAKIGQALLAAEAPVADDSRKQTAEHKKQVEETEKDNLKGHSAAKKSPAKEKKSESKESPKKDADVVKEPEEKAQKAATPRKRGGRPSLVDQLVQEAQKFAGNTAGDVNEGRVTRRASKGPETAAASPVKRGRLSKGKKNAADDEEEGDE